MVKSSLSKEEISELIKKVSEWYPEKNPSVGTGKLTGNLLFREYTIEYTREGHYSQFHDVSDWIYFELELRYSSGADWGGVIYGDLNKMILTVTFKQYGADPIVIGYWDEMVEDHGPLEKIKEEISSKIDKRVELEELEAKRPKPEPVESIAIREGVAEKVRKKFFGR